MERYLRKPSQHLFRMARPTAKAITESQRAFRRAGTATHKQLIQKWRLQNTVAVSLARQMLEKSEPDAATKAALAERKEHSLDLDLKVTSMPMPGVPIFPVRPGLNGFAPPYDYRVETTAGSNAAALMVSLVTGDFQVVAAAPPGTNTYGGAGFGLFLVPSDPRRTLSIRPYFQCDYSYNCHSEGPPTAHSHGVVTGAVAGRRPNGETVFLQERRVPLWDAGSTAWSDASGSDGRILALEEIELVVSGFESYDVVYSCQASADANETFWWWSSVVLSLSCRIPLLFVEET